MLPPTSDESLFLPLIATIRWCLKCIGHSAAILASHVAITCREVARMEAGHLRGDVDEEHDVVGNVLFSLDAVPVERPCKRPKGRPKKVVETRPRADADVDAEPDDCGLCVPPPFLVSLPLHGLGPLGPVPANAVKSIPQVELADKKLIMKAVGGRTPMTPIASALVEAASMALEAGMTLDPQVLALAEQHLHSQKCRLSSNVLKKDVLGGMEGKMFHIKLQRLAAALCIYQQVVRAQLEQSVLGLPRSAQLSYVETCKYDETPLKTTLAEGASEFAGMMDENIDEQTKAWLQTAMAPSKHEATIGKVLQLHYGYGILLQIGSKFIQVEGCNFIPLQALEANTGECIASVLAQQNYSTSASEAFKQCSRVVVCDKAPGNHRAEEAMKAWRGCHWSSHVVACQVHITALVFQKTFEPLVGQTIKGLHKHLFGIADRCFNGSLQEVCL